MCIEVGYGLEGVFNDVIVKWIIDEIIILKFKVGDLLGGIVVGVDVMLIVIDWESLLVVVFVVG